MGKGVRSKRKLARRKEVELYVETTFVDDALMHFESDDDDGPKFAETMVMDGKLPIPRGRDRLHPLFNESEIDRLPRKDRKKLLWFRKLLREPSAMWPNGTAVVFFNDGSDMAHMACAERESKRIESAIQDGVSDYSGAPVDSEWYPHSCDEFAEGPPEYCCICEEMIESTYGDPDAPEPIEEENGQQILQFNTGG